MKCRSEPQVVVAETRRIASCGLTRIGSGTVSTRRSFTPFQHSARMVASSLPLYFDCLALRRAVRALTSSARGSFARGWIVIERGDLARLDQALPTAQDGGF